MSQQTNGLYEFGSFRLNAHERMLLRESVPVALTPKAFDLLLVLVERQGQLVEKEELFQAVWPDSFVEESNLSSNIALIRKALDEGEHGRKYIETVPKHGYRFVAEVKEVGEKSVAIEESGEANREKRSIPTRLFVQSSRRNLLVITSLLLVIISPLSYFWFFSRSQPRSIGTDIKSIAVLPVRPLHSDENDEYLGIGLADAIITRLSSTDRIVVRPTSAIGKYTAANQDPLAAGREQQVDAVLEANLWRSGERVRVTARLLSVPSGLTLWSYNCEEFCTDVFAVQSLISEQLAEALMPHLTGEERTLLTKRYTSSAEANVAYQKGRFFWNKQSKEGLLKAAAYFEQAVQHDPQYAAAYAGLADAYAMLAVRRALPEKEAFPKAKEAALKALKIDETLANAHASLAHIQMHEWNWSEAEREFKRALTLNLNYPTAHQWYAILLSMLGRHQEAIAENQYALRLDPVSLLNNLDRGWIFFRAHQYDQAIEQCRVIAEIDPQRTPDFLGLAYYEKGMAAEALAAFLKSRGGDDPAGVAALREGYAASGWQGFWQKRLEQVLARTGQPPLNPFDLALLYVRLGDKEQAFKWLEKAYEERNWGIVILKTDPRLDSLRSDTRFKDLLRRVGLAP